MNAFDISTSALMAERTRMTVIANNVANQHTTRDEFGNVLAYRRRMVVLASGNPGAKDAVNGVHVKRIALDPSPLRRAYEPGHPDADADGYVSYPNVLVVKEMADMVLAARAYEANVAALDVTKSILERAGDIIR